jgi:hypothetical protein
VSFFTFVWMLSQLCGVFDNCVDVWTIVWLYGQTYDNCVDVWIIVWMFGQVLVIWKKCVGVLTIV